MPRHERGTRFHLDIEAPPPRVAKPSRHSTALAVVSHRRLALSRLGVTVGHISRSPMPAMSAATGAAIAMSNEAHLTQDAADSATAQASGRRALIRSAMDGMNRFKQSWVSVMLLKAGIGLGQVFALLVLLILSCILPSPLNPSQDQSHPSTQCLRPHLFRAWMWVQIVRLLTCWAVSCWLVVRTERARRSRRRRESVEEGEMQSSEGASHFPDRSRRAEVPLPSRCRSPGRQPSLSHSTTTTPASECPPILDGCSSPTLPDQRHFVIPPKADTDDLAISSAQYGSSAILVTAPTPTEPGEREQDHGNEKNITVQGEQIHVPRLPMTSRRSNRSLRGAQRMAQQRLHPELPSSPARSVNGEAVDEDRQEGTSWKSRTAAVFDRYALTASRCLGGISLVLFILGNVLLFRPLPSSDTCYGASPLLWWGVMLVVGIGYILFAQIFFVVIIVGLGGTVVLEALRRVGLLPAPPVTEPPRSPQPDPLTPAQVAQIPVLNYVPHPPAASAPLPSTSGTTEPHLGEKDLTSETASPHACNYSEEEEYDTSRLPFPPIYLAPHTSASTCVICQENYVPPREERAVLYRVDRLKKLGCGHVYHMDCIDEWLLKGSGICPACNQPVAVPPAPTPVTPGGGSADGSRRREASGQSSAFNMLQGERRRSLAMSLLKLGTRS